VARARQVFWKKLLAAGPAVGLALFVAGLALRPMAETDVFFRLAVGEQILTTGELPRRNLFSFTHPDHPDLDSAWLFDAGAALLFRAGGYPALVVIKALLLALVFAGAFALCRRRGAGPVATAATLAAAALVMSERFVERPHLFSFAGLVAVLLILDRAERRPRLLWLAPLACALWANLHAGAFLGPLVLAAAALGSVLDRRRSPAATPGPHPAAIVLVALASAGALLITPIGAGLFRYLAFHIDIHALHPVDEFRAPSWLSDAPLLLFAGATALSLLLVRRPPARWSEILPAVALALLASRSVRFGAELVLIAAPLLATRLTTLAARAPFQAITPRPAVPLLVAASLALVALAPRVSAAAAGRPFIDVALDREALPLAALDFVATHGLDQRMYNDFELGGYLAWTGFPRRRVFTDPRLPAYPPAFHAVMGRGDLTRAEWDAVMDRHGVDSALLTYAGINRRLAWWDPARWALVYRQGDARVFVRRLPRHRALIEAREIPATFSFSVEAGTRTLPLAEPPAGSPVATCEWQLRLGDLLFELDGGAPTRALSAYRRALTAPPGCLERPRAAAANGWVGTMLLGRGDARGALESLDRALALSPPADAANERLLASRALALETLGRRSEAHAGWLQVADRAADAPLARWARDRAARLQPGR
jgi:tetratricopeptide (TPR) repeat protein